MPTSSFLIIDGHVHIHDCFHIPRFFGSAFSNCLQVARNAGYESSHIPVLLLTEGRRQRVFRRIQKETKKGNDRLGDEQTGGYRVFATEEVESLRIQNMGGTRLFLISGRQIMTAERLEVLALSTISEIPDGLSLEETVAAVEKEGALPVIPWGFGKWIGRRGRIMKRFLENANRPDFFLGDNGGRPAFLPEPAHFSIGKERGIRILPGSDPLPYPSETDRAGSFGFTLRISLDPGRPAQGIRTALFDHATRPEPYGCLETPFRFLRNQIAMQMMKFGNRSRLEKQ
jgi:hypothetical protein